MTDINGFNNNNFSNGLFTSNIEDINQTVEILLTDNTIDLIGTNILINGAPIGGGGATTTLTSASGGTYSIVSDGLGPDLQVKGISAGTDILINDTGAFLEISADDSRLVLVEEKTQNITAISQNTDIQGFLNITPPTVSTFEPVPDAGTIYNSLASATDDSYGMRFTTTQQISIGQVGIPLVHWTGMVTTQVNFNFYEEGNLIPIAQYIVTKGTIQGNAYVELLGSPLVLPVGTYRMSLGYKPDMFQNGVSMAPMVFPPQIINVEGAGSPNPNGSYPTNIVAGQSYTRAGVFYYDFQGVSTLTTDTIFTNVIDSNNAEIDVIKTIDMNGFSIINCQNINNIRPSGGVYSQSVLSPIVGIQTDLNLIGLGLQFGTATIGANGFVAGDTFALKIGGSITCANGDVFIISLVTSTFATFATFLITIDGALTNGFWELEAEFMIRSTGTAGVASVVTNGNFNYINSVNFMKGVGVNSLENINFDTTVSTTLQILYTTAEVSITNFTPTQISITKLF